MHLSLQGPGGDTDGKRSAAPAPAVAEFTEVGVELSAEASQVVTGSRPRDIRVGRHARDPRGGVEAGDVMTGSLQQIRGPYPTMAAALAAYEEHLGLGPAWRRS